MAKRFVTTKVEVEGREETRVVELPAREPEPWGDDASLHIVGRRDKRMDALEKVTGEAEYTADIQLPGMLHVALARASVASGNVLRLDLEPALSMPGVRGVLVMDDVQGIKLDGVQLFDRTIHYASQPIAAVCADTLEIAERAARAIPVEIEPLPHAIDASAALADGAPRVKPHGNTHRASPRVVRRGDIEAGLREAEVTVVREYRTQVALQTALEPHGAVATWSGDRVTVWESTQGIFNTRADLAEAFDLPLSSVRVVKNYMGGGFGAKNGASFAAYTAVALSRKLRRPVRCVFDREGEQTDTGNRTATIQRVTLGARRDGTLTAISLDATIPLGFGGWLSSPARIYLDLYRCANVRTSEVFVFTNTAPMNSFRAPGSVEGAFGLESAMDVLARELDMDPIELRRRNYADHDQDKNRRYSGKHLDECYRAGAERFGWTQARSRKRDENSRVRRGVGMASLVWGAGGGPPAYATVRINGDGSIEVLTGAQDLGTGARTVMSQIAAEVLGAKLEDVRTVLGDTERLPFAPNSWGSITTASVGPAVRVAAEEARGALFEAAAGRLDTEPNDLEARDSELPAQSSDRCLLFHEVCEKPGDVMIIGQGSRGPNPDKTSLSAFGAQFAEVEVDTETGRVRVLRIVSAHDSGRIVNPTLAESQLEGGIIQGLGYALFEERVLDRRSGVPLNPTLHDYKIPTMADVPEIDAFFIDIPDPVANHTGAKGVAEPPIIGTAPAIANAVMDALGVEIAEIPMTPWRVLGGARRT
jgi:xanthine dehydrogenase YagR molybdenum-binding subunit